MRQYVCPACGAANRAPDGKDPLTARCGRCGAPLFTGHPTDVDARALSAHRVSTKGAAVLVEVWAPWCGPCRAMAAHYDAAAQTLEPQVRLLKLNAEVDPLGVEGLGIAGVPALVLFADGRLVARTAGLMSADQIVAWTHQALARAPSGLVSGDQP